MIRSHRIVAAEANHPILSNSLTRATRAQFIIFAQPKERFVSLTNTQLTRRGAREGRLHRHDRGPTTGGDQVPMA
jgi:hypothetical protein